MPCRIWRLGRVAGCVVQVHWSVVLILAPLTVLAAVGVLPAAAPGHAAVTYWLVALVAGAAFVASLVVHELAHVLVARRYGLRAPSITVWALGGVTLVEGEPSAPAAEFRLAAAGPLASLVAAVGMVGGAVQAFAVGAPMVVVTAFVWVGVVNAFVAVFSLLPAFPLDGARMFRATLWWLGDRASAARVTIWVGRALGVLLVVGGLVELVAFRQLGGVPMVLLGSFLAAAGARSAGEVEACRVLPPGEWGTGKVESSSSRPRPGRSSMSRLRC